MSDETTERRHPRVIHLDEAEGFTREQGTRFGATMKLLGAPTGGSGVGCNWFEVKPGRAAFPAHYHCAIEEVVFVLHGAGTLRIGEERVAIRAGDYITLPAGPEHAHQIINTGDEPLRYLCLSNQAVADVVGYPDSNKIAAFASPSANFMDPPWVRAFFDAETGVGYYHGEDTGQPEDGS